MSSYRHRGYGALLPACSSDRKCRRICRLISIVFCLIEPAPPPPLSGQAEWLPVTGGADALTRILLDGARPEAGTVAEKAPAADDGCSILSVIARQARGDASELRRQQCWRAMRAGDRSRQTARSRSGRMSARPAWDCRDRARGCVIDAAHRGRSCPALTRRDRSAAMPARTGWSIAGEQGRPGISRAVPRSRGGFRHIRVLRGMRRLRVRPGCSSCSGRTGCRSRSWLWRLLPD